MFSKFIHFLCTVSKIGPKLFLIVQTSCVRWEGDELDSKPSIALYSCPQMKKGTRTNVTELFTVIPSRTSVMDKNPVIRHREMMVVLVPEKSWKIHLLLPSRLELPYRKFKLRFLMVGQSGIG